MHKFYNNANRQIDDITRQYINKEILYDDAKFQIRNLEKQIHHKLTSDFSNNTVFGTKSKKYYRCVRSAINCMFVRQRRGR